MRVAGIRARQINRGFRNEEVEDLEQTLITEVLIRWPKYTAGRGTAEAFIESVIRSKACKIIRSRKRSLSRIRRIRDERQDQQRAKQHRDDICHASLKIDLAIVMEKMPIPLADACQQLGLETRSTIANAAGLSRNGLNAAITRSRALFRDHDLDLYL